MEIVLNDIGKRYRYDWIFQNLHYTFRPNQSYAITGPNGSGKSTLLKILCGHLSPSQGKLSYSIDNQALRNDLVYRQLSYAAPYIELIEELRLEEALHFHGRFKSFYNGMKAADIIELLGFEQARQKEIRNFSSGMKQRLKLALAICSQSSLLLLDEPTTNLDKQGVAWYQKLIDRFAAERLVIIASNVEADYRFCGEQISMIDYKKM